MYCAEDFDVTEGLDDVRYSRSIEEKIDDILRSGFFINVKDFDKETLNYVRDGIAEKLNRKRTKPFDIKVCLYMQFGKIFMADTASLEYEDTWGEDHEDITAYLGGYKEALEALGKEFPKEKYICFDDGEDIFIREDILKKLT